MEEEEKNKSGAVGMKVTIVHEFVKKIKKKTMLLLLVTFFFCNIFLFDVGTKKSCPALKKKRESDEVLKKK